MKVFYSRISTDDGQTHKRQLQDLKGFDYVFCDVVSGGVPLFERGKGSEIKKLMDEGKLTHLEVHSIDRLGRSTIDVLSNWKLFTENKVTVVCRNPNIRNFDDNGNPKYWECHRLPSARSRRPMMRLMVRDVVYYINTRSNDLRVILS
jgi:DNA invertase Pin-like site-specific DNA recombinase